MIIQRTTSDHPDFQTLAAMLERELELRDGDQHAFYAQLNKAGSMNNVIIAYHQQLPVGCGAFKQYNNETVEIKRMFVQPANRKLGIATNILMALEQWAAELGYKYCLLETGKNQPEAIGLYTKHRYLPIPNFGKYANSENSICFTKTVLL